MAQMGGGDEDYDSDDSDVFAGSDFPTDAGSSYSAGTARTPSLASMPSPRSFWRQAGCSKQ